MSRFRFIDCDGAGDGGHGRHREPVGVWFARVKLQPGDRLDRYTLLKLLGADGHGSVWMASDETAPGQTRTLKLLKIGNNSAEAVERIRLEARAIASLEHPSLAQVLVLLEDLRPRTMALIMDYIEGISLADALGDPRLTIRLREHALGHTLRALACVHDQGLAHRNLKLENVILARDFWQAPERPENVKLVDFGIALAAESKVRPADLAAGNAPYLAPEIVDPDRWGGVMNPMAHDVFAFGVLGSYLLSANHPTGLPNDARLKDYSQAYATAYQQGKPFSVGGYKGTWARIIESSTLVDPSKRPEDCQCVLGILASGPNRGSRPRVSSRPPGPAPSFRPVPSRPPVRYARFGHPTIGILVIAALTAVVLWFLYNPH